MIKLLAVLLLALGAVQCKKGGKSDEDPNIYNPGKAAPNHNGEEGKLFEGDILSASDNDDDRNAVSTDLQLWPKAIVPYTFHSNVGYYIKEYVKEAIEDFNAMTCIRWLPKDEAGVDHDDYVQIQSFHQGNDPIGPTGGGCYSNVGRIHRGKQPLNLENERYCGTKGVAIHEMLHALGFYHEHSRSDRDEYLTIHWDNIERGMDRQFKKLKTYEEEQNGFPYDYSSVMHYGRTFFAKRRGLKTMEPKKKGQKIGEQKGFSMQDIAEVNKLYDCCMDEEAKHNCHVWVRTERWSDGKKGCEYDEVIKSKCKKSCGLCN